MCTPITQHHTSIFLLLLGPDNTEHMGGAVAGGGQNSQLGVQKQTEKDRHSEVGGER